MNERERFRLLFRGAAVDRPPLLEEGVRDGVLETWHAQGLPPDKTHLEIFGLTPHENIGPDITPLLDGSVPLVSTSTRDYRRAFRVTRDRFPEDWRKTAKRLEDRNHIVCLWASRGFFQALGVEDWKTFRPAMHALIKDPAGVRDKAEIYGGFCARMLEMALRDVEPEFIYLSEPISDNRGSLISPAMFEEFMIPAYEHVIATARQHGCENILVSTYGNSALLFPSMIRAGVTMLWISEAAEVPDLDYRCLRGRFGKELGLIGGIPLSLLRSETSEEMKTHLREIIDPLLEAGRYIPLAGGRIREDVGWQTYQSYREIMREALC
jgi:uroporphyrinogen decarboxylase